MNSLSTFHLTQRDIKHRPLLITDQEQLDKEINDLRKELKAKVNHLNVIQGRPLALIKHVCSVKCVVLWLTLN